ncbi:MAG: thioredoxin domain-containing protein [Acidobacteria bacterium]|nr:thioredoxin domain-containing protein [Acidobacteriota bacterium]MBI3422731.1 thioredoxin domain-containing protein [Acidobacteriota bacterium]
MKRYLPFVIIGVTLLVIVGAGAWLFSASSPKPQPIESPAASGSPAATPAKGAAKTELSPTPALVKKDVVAIEEFGDYQCPPCGALHPILKSLKNEFGGRMQLSFYHFPLSQIHKNAVPAAMTSVAAALQGRFADMHNLLYDTQKVWSEVEDFSPIAMDYAHQIGLDMEKFKRDVNSPAVRAQIASDMQRATSLKVDSTPTLFLNGVQVPNEKFTLEELRKEINLRLAPRK